MARLFYRGPNLNSIFHLKITDCIVMISEVRFFSDLFSLIVILDALILLTLKRNLINDKRSADRSLVMSDLRVFQGCAQISLPSSNVRLMVAKPSPNSLVATALYVPASAASTLEISRRQR